MRYLLFSLCLLSTNIAFGQNPETSRWEGGISLTHHPASLVVPRFRPIHPGALLTLSYRWTANPKHYFKQSAKLGYFYHSNLQHAISFYTEWSYTFAWEGGLQITPLHLGGGYRLGILDMTSLVFDSEANRYEEITQARQHWLISLGSTIGYQTNWQLWKRPVSILLDYRIEVQGNFINETVPLLAYAPLMLGISLPL